MEDLSVGRIAALVPEFVVKDLPLGRTLMLLLLMMIMTALSERSVVATVHKIR